MTAIDDSNARLAYLNERLNSIMVSPFGSDYALDMLFGPRIYFGIAESDIDVTRSGTAATNLDWRTPSAAAYDNPPANTLRFALDGSGLIAEEVARENLFLNSATPATQTINLAAGDYVCWVNAGDGAYMQITPGSSSPAVLGTMQHFQHVAGQIPTQVPFRANDSGRAEQNTYVRLKVLTGGNVTFTKVSAVAFCQVEAGLMPSTGILTGGSSVTRPKEVITLSGTPFTSNYDSTKVTLFATFTPTGGTAANADTVPVSLSDNSAANGFSAKRPAATDNIMPSVVASSTSRWSRTHYGPLKPWVRNKVAMAASVALGGLLVVNGTKRSGTISIAAMPACTQLNIGDLYDGSAGFMGVINQIALAKIADTEASLTRKTAV